MYYSTQTRCGRPNPFPMSSRVMSITVGFPAGTAQPPAAGANPREQRRVTAATRFFHLPGIKARAFRDAQQLEAQSTWICGAAVGQEG